MLDLIYIVEDHFTSDTSQQNDSGYTANFTLSGQNTTPLTGKTAYSGVAVATAAAAAASSFLIPILPISMIIGAAATAAGVAGAGASLIAKDRSPTTDESATALAIAEETRLLTAYVQRHSLSRTQARESDYRFQPGHPVVGKAYRKHPLSDYSNRDNRNLYIPSDSYDAILLEERESELVKLLVQLGATKIRITKKVSDKTRSSISAEASVQVGPMGGGAVSYAGKTECDTDSLDTREFSLTGKPWKADSKVDRENFLWLPYEPSWKAVVFAREVGGCLTASLEIKENTSFSTDKNLELSVKAKLVEVGAQAGISNLETGEKTYFVKAEFAPVSHSA